MSRSGLGTGVYIGMMALSFAVAPIINVITTKKEVDTPAYHLVSFPQGYAGHTEYVQYASGGQDVKIIPSFGTKVRFFQDNNGDGLVDIIRIYGSGTLEHPLGLFTRRADYSAQQAEFDKADEVLEELMQKYGN